jgi:hypothetical protein
VIQARNAPNTLLWPLFPDWNIAVYRSPKQVDDRWVPEKLVEAMAGAAKGKALQKGIEIAGERIRQLKGNRLCHGVHIMPIGKEAVVPDILKPAHL